MKLYNPIARISTSTLAALLLGLILIASLRVGPAYADPDLPGRTYSWKEWVGTGNYWWLPGLMNVPSDGPASQFPPCEAARAGAPSPCAPLDWEGRDPNADDACWSGDCYYRGVLHEDGYWDEGTIYYEIDVLYDWTCTQGKADYCITPAGVSALGVETMPGQSITHLSGTRNGEPFTCPGDVCAFEVTDTPPDGVTFLTQAYSTWGDSSYAEPLTVKVDTLPPETTLSVTGQLGQNGIFLSALEVAFRAADATSGVASVEASLDGGPWLDVTTGNLAVTGEGVHSLHYRATDVAGWQEETQTVQLIIDTTPPRAALTVTCPLWGQSGYCLAPVTVQGSMTEAGTLTYIYRGETRTVAGPAFSFSEGRTDNGVLTLVATDQAGLQSQTLQEGVPPVDGDAPRFNFLGTNGTAVDIAVTDATSGVKNWSLKITDAAGQSVFWKERSAAYTGPVTLNGDLKLGETYQLEGYVQDYAGIEAHLPRTAFVMGVTHRNPIQVSSSPVVQPTDQPPSTPETPEVLAQIPVTGGDRPTFISQALPPGSQAPLTTITLPPAAKVNPPSPLGWLLPLLALLVGGGTGAYVGRDAPARHQLKMALLAALLTLGAGAGWQGSRTQPVQLTVNPRLQDPNSIDCGPAALGMAFDFVKEQNPKSQLPSPNNQQLVDWMKGRNLMHEFGTGVEELAYTAREQGYSGSFYFCNGTLEQLKQHLGEGRPVIASLKLDGYQQTSGHFVTLTGLSSDGQTLFINDPLVGKTTMTLTAFTAAWQANGGCGMVVATKPIPTIPESSAPLFGGVGAVAALATLAALGTARKGLGAGRATRPTAARPRPTSRPANRPPPPARPPKSTLPGSLTNTLKTAIAAPFIAAHKFVTAATPIAQKIVAAPFVAAHNFVTAATPIAQKIAAAPFVAGHNFVTAAAPVAQKILAAPFVAAHKFVTTATPIAQKILAAPFVAAHKFVTAATPVAQQILQSVAVEAHQGVIEFNQHMDILRNPNTTVPQRWEAIKGMAFTGLNVATLGALGDLRTGIETHDPWLIFLGIAGLIPGGGKAATQMSKGLSWLLRSLRLVDKTADLTRLMKITSFGLRNADELATGLDGARNIGLGAWTGNWLQAGVGLFESLGLGGLLPNRTAKTVVGAAQEVAEDLAPALATKADNAVDVSRTVVKTQSGSGVTEADLINGLASGTPQSQHIADLLKRDRIKIKIVGDAEFEKEIRFHIIIRGGVPPRDLSRVNGFAVRDLAFVRASSEDIFGTAVHEGTHLLNRWRGIDPGILDEKIAYYYQRQFQMFKGGRVEHPSLVDMLKHILDNY